MLMAALLLAAGVIPAGELALTNADFEAGNGSDAAGWGWWSRTKKGSATWTDADKHGGARSVRLEHDGEKDWAYSCSTRLKASHGQAFTFSAWVRAKSGKVTLATVAYGNGKALTWDCGSADAKPTDKWIKIEGYAEPPQGCDEIALRFVGYGEAPLLAWVDDVTIAPTTVRVPPPPKPKIEGYAKERLREKLDRAVVAMPLGGGKVYVSWRLLDSDAADVAFNVYRKSGDGQPAKLNAEPIKLTTDFVDSSAPAGTACEYTVRPVANNAEGAASLPFVVTPGEQAIEYLSVKLRGDYKVQKAGVADLDGDGRYDFVFKQPQENIDPYEKYWHKSPGSYKLDAYKHDGTFLWQYDLGWAIERGMWYSPYLVYDLDGDGKAEVICKAGEGDPRDADGRVQSGPEYVLILDGLTGKERCRADWIAREDFQKVGYNYASRNQLGIAYLDGKTPCLIVARGTYNLMIAVAYDFHDGKLRELWRYTNKDLPRKFHGQGAHWMHAVDVDADGRAEVILGSVVLDDNGDALWCTGLGHPDHCYVGDLDPARPGLEIYYGIETRNNKNSMCMVDAKTGQFLWGHQEPTIHIHSTGLVSDLDAKHPGAECYSGERDDKDKRWMRTAAGEVIDSKDYSLAPRAVYWDADPQRELLRGGKIAKYKGEELKPALKADFVAVADVVGDWREEIIACVNGEVRIYVTTIPAVDRRACLMQDPIYRLDVAFAAMGYYQVPMLSYDMASRAKAGK
jgi:rhamnogalacturonan endolyase